MYALALTVNANAVRVHAISHAPMPPPEAQLFLLKTFARLIQIKPANDPEGEAPCS